ncbi:uncharacterized protein LOC131673885 isoform X1 [Phymastichus coffea]|uniref:uncharacterized protein LOC131673885 isoform X1 n=1 Tax=Phymastichus coffea TaxID=108790 RepID=UPI00273CF01B|nr:uncharacterized protein LOC131673885 isoform X1 [Phymastichus coffea]
MRTAVALLLCVALPATFAMFAANINDDLLKMEEDCANENGVNFAEIELVRKHKFVPKNDKMSSWAFCMMVKHNVIKEDGTVNMDKMSIKIPTDTDSVLKAFEVCKSKTGKDKKKVARRMMNCYLREYQIVLSLIPRKSY